MREQRVCTRCGVGLKEFAASGLCPRCLLRGGLVEAETPSFEGGAQGATVLAGRRIGNYDLLEEIARGGMGVVYKARQRSLNRIVAVKLLLAGQFAEPKFVQRFRAEAEAAARLQHPNIVAIHEIGEHEGYEYFSMEYIEGRNLAQVRNELAAGTVDFRRCGRWVKTLAEAVDYAHQQGIIHRDLKPANVLIDKDDKPHITDFGLAKQFRETTDQAPRTTDLTVTGQVLGSPNYLPPEQAAGKPAGPASDVYSLGAILYHLLTGRPPFQAESLGGILKQVLESEPVAPRLLNPGIPADLTTICQKCLEKEPSRRYATAQALAEDLGRFLADEPIQARPVGTVGRAWKYCRRQPLRAALMAALMLVFALGATGVTWQWRRAEREQHMTLRQAYAGDMKVASFALEEGNLAGAKRLLDKYQPRGKAGNNNPKGESDLRGWEWRYLWGLCRSDEKFTLTRDSSGFANLALSPEGKLLAVQKPGGNIDLWDWRARQILGTLTNQGYPPAMALSPDGKQIASANLDSNGIPVISFWEVGTRRIIRNLPQRSPVTSVAFSPDSKLLAAFHKGPWCSLWRVPSGEWVTNYAAGIAVNMDMRIPLFSADSQTLVLGDFNGGSVIRWIDLNTGAIRELPVSTEGNAVMAMALSPDGRVLASGYGFSAAAIDLWDFRTGAQIGRLEGHRGWVKKLVFSADGQTLYSGSADQSVRAWNLKEKRERNTWRGHTGTVTGLAISPEQESVLSCAQDGSVRVWDAQGPLRRPAYAALPVRGGPYGAPFTSDSRKLITASATVPVTIWEVATGRKLEEIEALGTNHLSVALSPDERWLATGSLEGAIQIWDMRRQTIVSRFQANSNGIPIFAMRFLPGDNSLLSFAILLHQSTELKRWEAATWRQIPSGVGEVAGCSGFALSPNGQQLVMAYETGPVKLWNLRSGRLEATFGSGGAGMSAISRDGRFLAAPTGGGVLVCDLMTRRQITSFEQQVNLMISATFSADGRRVVTGSMVAGELQPALEVWDVATGRGLFSLRSQGSFTGFTEFSPDGNTLLALSWHGTTELWRAPSWAEIEAAERDANIHAVDTAKP